MADRAEGPGPGAADAAVTPFASPRRLAAHITGVAAKAADRSVLQKLMPVAVAWTPTASPPRAAEEAGRLGADASGRAAAQARTRTARPRRCSWTAPVPGATLADGLQKALAEALAKLPIPKVMSLPAGSRPTADCSPAGPACISCARPWPGGAAWHRRGAVSAGPARPAAAPRATASRRRSTRCIAGHADSYAATCAEEGAVIASFAERRAEIARQLQAAAARRQRPAAHRRRGPARRGDGPGRAPQRAAVPVRAGVPGGAAGVPDPDDEGQPEVLSAARRRTAS
jgi:glycyl-tRNA synthetase beta chain